MSIESFVGRDGSARIVIDGHETKFRAPECSRTHALVDVDDECRLIVTDQDAANGTEADGTPLAPHTPTVVPNGVRLQLGDAAVRIEAYPPNQSPGGSATATAVASHKEEAS